MRYAFVSDIHANLHAWKSVLLDIRSSNVDAIICLGDIVGYGPNPAEVLESIYRNVEYIVIGNHDAAIADKLDTSLFNEDANYILNWTHQQLNKHAIKFLSSLPLTLHAEFFKCTHGDFSNPYAFNYLVDPHDALQSWNAVDDPIIFVGHTHQPAIFVIGASGIPYLLEPQDFEMEEGKRYIVNPGSVGQPRDGEARASYCIFDVHTRQIFWRRVPFDIDAYRETLQKTELPLRTSYFLCHDPREGKPPLRKILNFRPAKTPAEQAKNLVETVEFKALKQKIKKWQLFTTIALCVGALAITTAIMLWRHYKDWSFVIPSPELQRIDATTTGIGTNLLLTPSTPISAGNPLNGWVIRLGDRRKQSIEVVQAEENQFWIEMKSDSTLSISISTPIIQISPEMKLYMDAMFKKDDSFDGNIALNIMLIKSDKTASKQIIKHFITKEPNLQRKGGWLQAKQTFELPSGSESLQFQVIGNFKGKVFIRDLILCRKE